MSILYYLKKLRSYCGTRAAESSSVRIWHYLRKLYAHYRISPEACRRYFNNIFSYCRGFTYAEHWLRESGRSGGEQKLLSQAGRKTDNPLLDFFRGNTEGPGIWKWEHYFEVYQRHLSGFVNRPVTILEIGVYSGGSLNMWKAYFGKQSHIYGVDIELACKTYEREGVTILIGDQKDRSFWKSFRDTVPGIDVLIDDGGHQPEQQMVTLEEMLPHIRPGGVYLCEDIHGLHHEFMSFATGLISEMNRSVDKGAPAGFQKCIHSIHLYPYLLVIEKHRQAPSKFDAPKYGTKWQPFFDRSASR